MNILIKLMSIVSLVVAPTLAQIHSKNQVVVNKTESASKIIHTEKNNQNTAYYK